MKIEPADMTVLPLPDTPQAFASVSYLSLNQGAEREDDEGKQVIES